MFERLPMPDYAALDRYKESAPPEGYDSVWQPVMQGKYEQGIADNEAIKLSALDFEGRLKQFLKGGFTVIAQYPSDAPGGVTLLLYKPD